ncbi:exopolysaccharide Pel transporter PelG [Tepidibacter hydrothermalis]|uniref:Exopolysaccharide Pel transporter PelG n=1 Tax=Tepidibacter hydrothermalis TaxID=3036126 RepID=A0ABY8EDV5_9FIRM|nr:exopolysaccharide Pel transporter PelG [Tepidibacter hydrothermalis]WFD11126.1 exopolysaccharide Pel transporter PelG [Tepidibacter hydrothermalis]
MAGIGFTLKKLFKEEFFTTRLKAYMYSSIVAAGPWIAAVLTVNILLFMSEYYFDDMSQKDLFMGTIVYSFVFSQIITAPWQLLITRYISDKLYVKDYDYIKSSFTGLSRLVFVITYIVGFIYYYKNQLPLYYKFMSLSLFVFISLIWIIMVYLSAIKNYSIISYAYIIGGIISIILSVIFINYSLQFKEYSIASGLLLAYLIGIIVTYSILLYSFLSTFYVSNNKEYDFLRYLSKFYSLFYIGLFYTLGLWIDDILMWYSPLGVDIYETYKYAPLYDNAVFIAYLTVIPTMVLFMVSIETEFYDKYKKYYTLSMENGTYDDIEVARKQMEKSVYKQMIYTMETQTIISLTLIVISGKIFSYLGIPIIIRDIFRIAALGALCNIFILIIILILLYFESRKFALTIASLFMLSNAIFTLYFIPKGIEFYGFGYFMGSFITLVIAIVIMVRFLKDINYYTFGKQPLFIAEEKGIFASIANNINTLSNDIENE